MSLKKIICRIRNSFLYGIMIDEFTDISVTHHFVVLAIIIEECVPMNVFLSLLEIEGRKKMLLLLMNHLKFWKFDYASV